MRSRKMEGHKHYQYSATKALVLQPKPSNRIKNLIHIPSKTWEGRSAHAMCVISSWISQESLVPSFHDVLQTTKFWPPTRLIQQSLKWFTAKKTKLHLQQG
jgi:hypothetical protein